MRVDLISILIFYVFVTNKSGMVRYLQLFIQCCHFKQLTELDTPRRRLWLRPEDRMSELSFFLRLLSWFSVISFSGSKGCWEQVLRIAGGISNESYISSCSTSRSNIAGYRVSPLLLSNILFSCSTWISTSSYCYIKFCVLRKIKFFF